MRRLFMPFATTVTGVERLSEIRSAMARSLAQSFSPRQVTARSNGRVNWAEHSGKIILPASFRRPRHAGLGTTIQRAARQWSAQTTWLQYDRLSLAQA
jgi:hypothetical protein